MFVWDVCLFVRACVDGSCEQSYVLRNGVVQMMGHLLEKAYMPCTPEEIHKQKQLEKQLKRDEDLKLAQHKKKNHAAANHKAKRQAKAKSKSKAKSKTKPKKQQKNSSDNEEEEEEVSEYESNDDDEDEDEEVEEEEEEEEDLTSDNEASEGKSKKDGRGEGEEEEKEGKDADDGDEQEMLVGGLSASAIQSRNKIYEILLARSHDVNSFTRSKVLQTWIELARYHRHPTACRCSILHLPSCSFALYLLPYHALLNVCDIRHDICRSKTISVDRMASVVHVAIDRLTDKNAAPRKYAVELLATLLQFNPFGPNLHIDAYHTHLQQLLIHIKVEGWANPPHTHTTYTMNSDAPGGVEGN
jgi:hypothetical protein